MPQPSGPLSEALAVLPELEKVALDSFGSSSFTRKPDGSLVTPVDVKVEELFRAHINRVMPNAGVWGEELGIEEEGEDGLWLLDPIDGTSNYAFGLPEWGITISYMKNGRLEAGLISLPPLGDLLWAEDGAGAYRGGQLMPQVRPGGMDKHELAAYGFQPKTTAVNWPGKVRILGSFVSNFHAFAVQGCRAFAAAGPKLYDVGGGVVIAREIGAQIIHLDGGDFDEKCWLNGDNLSRVAFLPQEWPHHPF